MQTPLEVGVLGNRPSSLSQIYKWLGNETREKAIDNDVHIDRPNKGIIQLHSIPLSY